MSVPTEVMERADAGDAVALARVLVAIPSVNPTLEVGGGGEEAVAGQCARWLEGWGFAVAVTEVAPGRANVVARRGGGGRRLIFNGHLDTVGVAGMTVSPFAGEIVDGRLLGRGSCDMKGGVAALLSAAVRVSETELAGELIVVLTADEEHASIGMQGVVEAGLQAEAAVVCEPTNLAVMPAHKGFAWAEAVFRGRAAHGSRPEVGIDAIRLAGEFLVRMAAYGAALEQRPAHPLLAHGSVHAGTISGGVAPSVYPEECRVVLERRTLPAENAEGVFLELDELLRQAGESVPGWRAELRRDLYRPGSDVPTDSALVQGLLHACTEVGIEPRVEGMTAWVDAAFLNEAGTPAVCFGPGSIEQAHSADEWIQVDEIEQCAQVLEAFARRFLGVEG